MAAQRDRRPRQRSHAKRPQLNASASAELIKAIDDERRLTAEAAVSMLAKAEGNPFFMEELARTVIDQGPDADGIPETVTA